MPAPTLDGFATGTRSGANNVAATLTTTQTNNIICVAVHFEIDNTLLYVTGVSGAGLTWNFRSRCTATNGFTGTIRQTVELWWAVAPSALAAQVITVTTNANFDDASTVMFGVHGCNTANPWDANLSLPARQFGTQSTGSTNPQVTGVSTTNANDFLIFIEGAANSNPGTTVPAGFTSIGLATNSGGSHFSYCSVGYQGITAAVSGQTYVWGGSAGGNNGYNMTLFDALTADSGGVTAVPGVDLESVVVVSSAVAIQIYAPSGNEVLVVGSYATQPGTAISSVSGGGLTWSQRTRSNGSALGSLEIWSAKAGSVLASQTVTVTYASAPGGAVLFAMVLTGTAAQAFDSNSSVPAHVSNTAHATTWPAPSLTISTDETHDILLAVVGLNFTANATQLTSVPTGFRVASISTVSVGSGWQTASIAFSRVATRQSSAAITWGAALTDNNVAGNTGGEYVVDALTADIPAIPSSTAVRVMVMA